MKETFQYWAPKEDSLKLLAKAQVVIDQYQEAGFVLTLRQLYYQFVARDWIENTERSYKNLGALITKGRMAGFLDWDAIEDRNREHNDFWFEENPMVPILDLPRSIRFDRWARQDTYVEVWVEKEALGNVISKACDPFLVPHMSCKGYLSASEAWRAGKRFEEQLSLGKRCVILHLGDHDPSGMDMTRDNRERVNLLSNAIESGFGEVEVQRLALNYDQIDQYSPPPNPAKLTDTRAKDYIKTYGSSSWELDALEPQVIVNLIDSRIRRYIDVDRWEQVAIEERAMRSELRAIGDNWGAVQEFLKTL